MKFYLKMKYENYLAYCRLFLENGNSNYLINDYLFPVKDHSTFNSKWNYINFEVAIFVYFLFKALLKFSGRWVIFFLKSLFHVDNFNFQKNDIVIISHIISEDCVRDRYFGNFGDDLVKLTSQKYIKFFINHLPNYKKKSIFTIQNDCNFITNYKFFKISFLSFLHALFKNNAIVPFRIRLIFAIGFFSPSSRRSLLISNYVLNSIDPNKLKKLFITCEGHSWEKTLLKSIKNKNPNVKVYAYCNGFITNSQSHLGWDLNFCPDFDFFMTVGKNSSKALFNFAIVKNKIIEIGKISEPQKWMSTNYKSLPRFSSFNQAHGFIILLDGEETEINIALNLTDILLELFPLLSVYIKPHPITFNQSDTLNKIERFILLRSRCHLLNDNYDMILSKNFFVFYRGSTAVADCIKLGYIPLLWGWDADIISPISSYVDLRFDKEANSAHIKNLLTNVLSEIVITNAVWTQVVDSSLNLYSDYSVNIDNLCLIFE